MRCLDAFGFQWTGPILKQSNRVERYEAALARLANSALVYPCTCSRKTIAAAARLTTENDEPRYPGWCRNKSSTDVGPCAIRLKVEPGEVAFQDEIQGACAANVAMESGDFVIKRRDGLFAYQLAVVVDDSDQGISHVVRGADLLTSTPRQILLQRALGVRTPKYAHVPLATDDQGVKLSKSAGAGAVDDSKPAEELWRALQFLAQAPPSGLRSASVDTVWTWAVERWTTSPLRGLRQGIVASSTVRSG